MADTTSILTGGSNSFQTTAEHLNARGSDFFSTGVVGVITNTAGVAPATGALALNAQGSPNMTIAATAGTVYVTTTPTGQASQLLRSKVAAQNITISANATGSTRYDWVYAKHDATNANTPNVAGDNVLTLVTSRSTSNTTDNGTPPTYGTLLGIVTVANGASSIANASIADKRVRAAHVGGLNDVNGNELVKSSATASAVNEVTITNAATGNAPAISATGDDTNISLNLVSKGTGVISFNGVSTWTSFTPTFTNLTVGNGTTTASYIQIGKLVIARVKFVMGSTSSMTGNPLKFSLPVTAANTAGSWAAQLGDSGVQGYFAQTDLVDTSTAEIVALGSASTYVSLNNVTATVPFTWGTSDYLMTTIFYEAA